jgi:hypothetical protein
MQAQRDRAQPLGLVAGEELDCAAVDRGDADVDELDLCLRRSTRAMSSSKQMRSRTSASPSSSPRSFSSSARSSSSFVSRPLRRSKAPRWERGSFSKNW